MIKNSLILLSIIVTSAVGLTLASDGHRSTTIKNQTGHSRTRPLESTSHVLATVNSASIGQADVNYALSNSGHDREITTEHMKNILDVIIKRELTCQRAVELGLDTNSKYQEKLRRMEAKIDAFKRKELSSLFWREILSKTVVSENEGRKYFKENAERIRTDLHVWQILHRKEGSIEKIRNELEHGVSIEEIVRRQFPRLPKSVGAPWDLGYLKWNQVPDSWRKVIYGLKKGEVSGVIRGPNNRFWIIKLIDKRQNAYITFDSIKPTIMEALRTERIDALRKKTEQHLRIRANIVYLNDPIKAVKE